MGFVANVITPIIQACVYTFILGGICYGVYRGIKGLCPNIRWVIKYKVLKKKYDEEKVIFCMDAYDKKVKPIDMKKAMYLAGKGFKETDEMLYIYDQIFKKLEGGVKNGKFR